MPRACAQAVEIVRMNRMVEHNMCTLFQNIVTLSRKPGRVYTHRTLRLCTDFPQPKNGRNNLLLALFSPQSTPPITTTTTYIN
jgi:hypothetical protein